VGTRQTQISIFATQKRSGILAMPEARRGRGRGLGQGEIALNTEPGLSQQNLTDTAIRF
jgi:hypothetical protein